MGIDVNALTGFLSGARQLETPMVPNVKMPPKKNNTDAIAYALATLGRGISPEGSFGDKVGQTAQGQVRTNRFAQLLQKAMGPDESSMTINNKGFNFKGVFDTIDDDVDESKLGSLTDLFPSGPQDKGLNFNASDLVGLMPEDIETIARYKKAAEQEPIEQMKDMINMKYQLGLINQMQFNQDTKLIEMLTKDDRSDLMKNFDNLNQSRMASGQAPLTFSDFFMATKNDALLQYQRYKDEGGDLNFTNWFKDIKKAGATVNDFGDIFKETSARELAKDISNLSAPEYITNVEKRARDLVKYEMENSLDWLNTEDEAEAPSMESRVIAKTIKSFRDDAESLLGEGNVLEKWDEKNLKVRWYDTRTKPHKLIRSYSYGTK